MIMGGSTGGVSSGETGTTPESFFNAARQSAITIVAPARVSNEVVIFHFLLRDMRNSWVSNVIGLFETHQR
jgi:hypothetical protein